MKQPVLRFTCLAVVLATLLCRLVLPVYGVQNAPLLILDAGHGGEDGGAVAADGTPESGINLAITRRLASVLIFLGHRVCMTREGEGAVYSPEAKTLREKKVSDLQNRAAMINEAENAFVISIHQNSIPSHPKVHGAKVFYNGVSPAEQAAMAVQRALDLAANGGELRHVTAIDSSIYLMKESRHGAILVECGFLSNANECRRLQDPNYQTRLAAAIAAGCESFFTEERERVHEE